MSDQEGTSRAPQDGASAVSDGAPGDEAEAPARWGWPRLLLELDRTLASRWVLLGAIAVIVAVLAIPLWSTTLLPYQDYPQHLAMATVLRHFHDPAWGLAQHFVIEWFELSSYWVQYGTLAVLGLVFPMEAAGKVQILLTFAMTLLAATDLCRAFDRRPWLALMIAPLLYNTNLHYGFISFCLAVPFWFWGLAATERMLQQWSRRRAVIAGGLYALAFLTHQQVFVLLVATAGVLILVHENPRGVRQRVRALVPLTAVCVLLFVPWVLQTLVFAPAANEVVRASGVDQTYGRLGSLGLKWRSMAEVTYNFFRAVLMTLRSHDDRGPWVAWAFLSTGAFVLGQRRVALSGFRRSVHVLRMEIALVVSIGLFLLFPSSMKGVYYMSPRYMALVLMLWALLPRFRTDRAAAAFAAAALAVTCWQASIFADAYRRFDAEVGAMHAAVDTLPMGARVLYLSYGRTSSVVHLASYMHMGAYTIVRRGGIVSNTFAKTAGVPIRYRDPVATPVYKGNSSPLDDKNREFFDHVLLFRGPTYKKAFPASVVTAVKTFDVLYKEGRWTVLRIPPGTPPPL